MSMKQDKNLIQTDLKESRGHAFYATLKSEIRNREILII